MKSVALTMPSSARRVTSMAAFRYLTVGLPVLVRSGSKVLAPWTLGDQCLVAACMTDGPVHSGLPALRRASAMRHHSRRHPPKEGSDNDVMAIDRGSQWRSCPVPTIVHDSAAGSFRVCCCGPGTPRPVTTTME
jgi:hypothetical protein